ncbi:MAG TPA: RNA polymerase sigma factor [Solirubrobacteraceae bacterium]|nr:RNA polymerase sigma factor [Solirubrobacteraceae bacterium]
MRRPAALLRALGDERLAALIAEGDDRAFEVLYLRHHTGLERYCRSLVRSEADTQDALQNALTKALLALRAQQRNAPVKPWLFRIVHNEAISLLRRRRPERELSPDADLEALLGSAPPAHQQAEERARLALLLADLDTLAERQRSALILRELGGFSHQELAQTLEISVGVAKQTLLEARRALAEREEGRSMSCEEIQRMISDGDRRVLRGRRISSHLDDCGSCAAFAAAIPARRRDLHVIAPALPAAAVAGPLLAALGRAGGGSGAAGGTVAGAGGAGATAKLGLGTMLSVKGLGGGAALLAAAAGTAGVIHAVDSHHQRGTVPHVGSAPATHAPGGRLAGSRARAGTQLTFSGRRTVAGTRALGTRDHTLPTPGHPRTTATHPVGQSAFSSTTSAAGSSTHARDRSRTGHTHAPGLAVTHGASSGALGHPKTGTGHTHTTGGAGHFGTPPQPGATGRTPGSSGRGRSGASGSQGHGRSTGSQSQDGSSSLSGASTRSSGGTTTTAGAPTTTTGTPGTASGAGSGTSTTADASSTTTTPHIVGPGHGAGPTKLGHLISHLEL